MKQSGRPRRSEEQPDSPFGETLKQHLRRVKNLSQAELAKESLIAEKTLSNMVKGKRQSGTTLRRDLRAIIKVLYQKKALHSLEEANQLITKIPAIKELDERDPDDAEIIELLNGVAHEVHPTYPSNPHVSETPSDSIPPNQSSVPSLEHVPSQTFTTIPEIIGKRDEESKRRRQSWFIGLVILLVVTVFSGVLFKSLPFPWATPLQAPDTCPDTKDGVTLYTDPYFQGHCHVFPPGDYDLSYFGLDQNVSSLKDPDAAYYVRLVDRTSRPGSFDQDVPQLPADWNDQAHSLHVEKHRQQSHTEQVFHVALLIHLFPL